MLRTLGSCLGEYKRSAILAPIFTSLEAMMEILIPFVTAAIIDQGIEGENISKVLQYGAILFVLACFGILFGILAGKYASYASAGFAANLREKMFCNVQTFAFSNIDKYSTAGLVTRLTTDVTNLQNAFMQLVRTAVRSPFMLICSFIMCFLINKRLSLIFAAAMVVLAVILISIAVVTMPMFQQVFDRYDALNGSVQENIIGVRVVKAFVREDYEQKKFNNAADRIYRVATKAESILAFNQPIMNLTVYMCMVLLSWFGAHFIVAGSMTTGNLTSLMSYAMSMMMSLGMLSMIFVMLSMSIASARRICEVLNEEPDMVNKAEPVTEVPDGSIDFDHVYFAYNESGDDVLEDIDLHIHAGETIGIIGGTGSGKSSFVSLISRLYDVKSGAVRVGGVDVRDYEMDSLRKQVSVVLQKNVLFSGTILENLRWGKEDATEEECIEACRQACADEFIDKLPDGYNTWIEQGGSNVSGGQRQRLCIARALLSSPKVLILDDSTSAVDTATDAQIKRSFAQKIPGTTKIIVSQRISSIESADRILVLDDGKISGFATHDELMQTNEIYREIYEVQTEGGGDFDEPGKEE